MTFLLLNDSVFFLISSFIIIFMFQHFTEHYKRYIHIHSCTCIDIINISSKLKYKLYSEFYICVLTSGIIKTK